MDRQLFTPFTVEDASFVDKLIEKDRIDQLPRLMCSLTQKELVEKCIDSSSVNLLYRLLQLPNFLFFEPKTSYKAIFDEIASEVSEDDTRYGCVQHVKNHFIML